MLLQVSPKLRPSCGNDIFLGKLLIQKIDAILSLPFILNKLEQPFFYTYNEKTVLLKTIRYTHNFNVLSQTLPPASYSLPNIKPLNRNRFLSEMKIHKKNSICSSEKMLKLPQISNKKAAPLLKSVDSPRLEYDLSEKSKSLDSKKHYLKKKHKIKSLLNNLAKENVHSFFLF